jgi:dephospho-CoA kinase
MSGAGKSTALTALEQRGYRVVDTDFGDWIEEIPGPGGTGLEPQWREDRINALITEHERSNEPLFIAGTVWNQGKFYPRFDQIVLLSAPLDVMLERIIHRDTNPFGKTTQERGHCRNRHLQAARRRGRPTGHPRRPTSTPSLTRSDQIVRLSY